MAQKGSQQFRLPQDLTGWRRERKTLRCEDMDIHNLKTAKSASEIQNKQFLTLKVFWSNQKQTQMVSYLTQIGFDEQMFEGKREAMRDRVAWKSYLQAIADNEKPRKARQSYPWTRHSNFPDELGGFQLVLRDQLVVLDLDEEDHANASLNKVVVTPMRRGIIAKKLRPAEHKVSYTEASETPQRSSLFRILGELSANRKDYEEKFDDAEDEQIVNTALVSLLNALWIHEERNSEWTMKRKEFTFQSKDTGAGFVARTDGHLQVGNKSAAILEVKARARPRDNRGDHKIEMQESAQMALWIAQEPHSHWASGGSTDAKGKKSEMKFHRVLISQDRHQIYLIVGEYTQKYIDYLRNKSVDINDGDFALHMKMFGPYDTSKSAHMELLGVLVKVILTHAANAVKTASTLEDLGRDFASMNVSKGKERAPGDSLAEMSMSGRPPTEDGRVSSESSSRGSSPTPDVITIGRNHPVADSEL